MKTTVKYAAALAFTLVVVAVCRSGCESSVGGEVAPRAAPIAHSGGPATVPPAGDAGPMASRVTVQRGPDEACETIRRCVATYAKVRLESADLNRFLTERRAACFPSHWQQTALPMALWYPTRTSSARS